MSPRIRDVAARRTGLLAALALGAFGAGCQPAQPDQQAELANIDSVMAELGGTLMSRMERGQRWRMIASVGVGLPPTELTGDELPEPGSRGAGLVQVYCVQCHWLPTPRMHSAEEWKIILPRMYLRARQLQTRMGGPLTTGMVGEVVMSGYESAVVPSQADADTLLAYMQDHALPTADPATLSEGPGRAAFTENCSICHEIPSPTAQTASGWDRVVNRMQEFRELMHLEPLTPQQFDSITAYLRQRSAR